MPTRTARPKPTVVPYLENGDRLTRAEFERRYDATPNLRKAELIEGVAYLPSPTRHREHAGPQSEVNGWLYHYAAYTPGVRSSDNPTLRMDLDNEPQPDATLFLEKGGRSRLDDEGYIEGAPELIAEIAASSSSYDLGPKKNVYRRNGVQEYVVWRVLDGEVDWFVLRDEVYAPLDPGKDSIFRSVVFPGLWLDPEALLARDARRVLQVLDRGLASPEHATFAAGLRRKKRS